MEKYTYEINGRKSNEILKAQTKQKRRMEETTQDNNSRNEL